MNVPQSVNEVFAQKFSNKLSLHTYMSDCLVSTTPPLTNLFSLQGFNLMLYQNTPLSFLQDVVQGKKRLFKKVEVKDIPLKK